MSNLIDRQTAIDAVSNWLYDGDDKRSADQLLSELPSAQPESTRTFVELVVEYPDPELCTYKEYKGKPYYSIKYIENGETHVGYGAYKPEVLSQFLKEYFIPFVQPEPLSDAYMKSVWTWLIDYQIKAAELKGRYTPYEVLSWVANDWRKEHDYSQFQKNQG